jgi:regulator of ribosome biosynthesis
MLAIDTNQLDNQRLADRDQREIYLQELARENTQLLINSIWGLPTERVEDVVVAKFPPPTFRLPREKPVPKPKPPTKWEKYAKEKGIEKKKKKDRVVWDDVVQQWVPQFGYKKNKVEAQKNWCIPIKEGPDPNLHPFESMAEEKKERIAKNELQRLRNIAKSKGGIVAFLIP